ncbi:hypothetical protein HaLaN_28304 [Haematococcus lacustris]|uniref:Uncharacterized protein n=1 Tax=Haematococcus lacustris TaxID=44745 RepID=A0A6A0AA75_HAELA|nr:hypothetical protein HaLaN_28304 [Haematococcus lacustris]
MRVSARVTEVGSRPIASMLHSLHGVMTGAGARLVDLKRGQPIQVQEFEEFRFNTFEASMVCMNALRSAQQPHPSLSKVWNSSGKKALAQGLVTADWATLAAAMEQAVLPSSGRTNASVTAKTLVTWCKAERHLLKINVSMALGKASSWRSGVKLLQVSWGGQLDYGGRDGAKEGGRLISNPTPAPVTSLQPWLPSTSP